ncbi:MAG: nicotinate (nicotinamide) nucleotide adenylyltransferase [Candidatus Riflebacteria bacterium]
MRIGIFGGSFNPIHRQHLVIARAARDQLGLDQVLFIPVFQPVHKSAQDFIDYRHRRRMLELAIEDEPSMGICDAEKELGGASYTIRTVRHLLGQGSDQTFFLIIGGDSLADLATWREIDNLVHLVEFVVVERPGFKKDSPVTSARLHWVQADNSPVSSTAIRKDLRLKKNCCNELDPRVLFYIFRHNLYGAIGDFFAAVLAKLNKYLLELPDGLQRHIESVAFECFLLAVGAEVPLEKAVVAGLAHDIFRIAPAETILNWAARGGWCLKESEIQMPMLAHGAAAAGMLREEFPGIDSEVLEALRFHTLPEPGLSDLAKILVIADTLDPSRQLTDRESLRNAAMSLEEKFARVLALKRAAIKDL